MVVVESSQQVAQRFVHDAQGDLVPSPSAFLERGVNSPFPATPIEYNGDLFPRIIALRTYEKMKRNDAQIRATLRAVKIPVLGGDWYVEPADTSDAEKQLNADAAEFVEFNLFENLTITWQQLMHHILTMLDYGSSWVETVYEVKGWRPQRQSSNSRNFVMLRKLAPRPAVTIAEFLYDPEGGPDGIVHEAVDPSQAELPGLGFPGASTENQVYIPIEDMLGFVFDQEGGNLEGMSILRTAYQHWYYKSNLYKIDAIQKERHGIGIPDIELPPGYDQNDLQYAANMARNIRTNERAFILRPQGWVVGFAKVEGQLTDALKSAEHHDMMIARNVLASFINATGGSSGAGAGGSRSNSAVAMDLFLKSLREIGNLVCDVINKYLIPKLVSYNFQVTRYPKLKVRGIGEARNQQELSTVVRNLVSVNALSMDDSTEKYLREVFDLPAVWDKSNVRINDALLHVWGQLNAADPSGGTAQAPKPQPTAKQPTPATVPKPNATRGATTGNMPKGTTQG
jgi:hypothetical protein